MYCKFTVRLHPYAVMKHSVPNSLFPENYPTFLHLRGKSFCLTWRGQRVLSRLELLYVSLKHMLFLGRNICLCQSQLCLTCSTLKAIFWGLNSHFLHWLKSFSIVLNCLKTRFSVTTWPLKPYLASGFACRTPTRKVIEMPRSTYSLIDLVFFLCNRTTA